jgi:DnaJ-class molecular chaperone
MALICHLCHGKGEFPAYTIKVNDKIVEVPRQKCLSCDGKGIISAHPALNGLDRY